MPKPSSGAEWVHITVFEYKIEVMNAAPTLRVPVAQFPAVIHSNWCCCVFSRLDGRNTGTPSGSGRNPA